MKAKRIASAALAVAFLATIFGFFGSALIGGGETLYRSIFYRKAKAYLTDAENYDFFEMTSARIASLDKAMNRAVPLNRELTELNATLGGALGKRLIAQGGQTLLRLNDGSLYKLDDTETLAPQAREMIAFAQKIEVPLLFSFITPKRVDGMAPFLLEGYEALDRADHLADEVLSMARDAGLTPLDSREFLQSAPYSAEALWYSTDGHWTPLAALYVARLYAEALARMTGVALDLSRLDLAAFEQRTYADFFLGDYGQDVGAQNVALDDVTLLLPTYPTDISHTWQTKSHEPGEASGAFEQSCIHWDMLEAPAPNETAYAAYGLVEYTDRYVNRGECADLTVLIYKDSYTAPVAAFLSLLVKEVVCVDLRTAETDVHAMDFVEDVRPDAVILSYSRPMLEAASFSLS